MTRRDLTHPYDNEIARAQLTLPTGQPRPCPACDGHGHHGPEDDPVPCQRCQGTGQVIDPAEMEVPF